MTIYSFIKLYDIYWTRKKKEEKINVEINPFPYIYSLSNKNTEATCYLSSNTKLNGVSIKTSPFFTLTLVPE